VAVKRDRSTVRSRISASSSSSLSHTHTLGATRTSSFSLTGVLFRCYPEEKLWELLQYSLLGGRPWDDLPVVHNLHHRSTELAGHFEPASKKNRRTKLRHFGPETLGPKCLGSDVSGSQHR